MAHSSIVAMLACYERCFQAQGPIDKPGHVPEPPWTESICYELAKWDLACGACKWVSMKPGHMNLPPCTAL